MPQKTPFNSVIFQASSNCKIIWLIPLHSSSYEPNIIYPGQIATLLELEKSQEV